MVERAFGKMAYPTRYPLRYAHFPYIEALLPRLVRPGAAAPVILDLGCGPGVLVRLCDPPAGSRCLGLDLWPAQLCQAAASGGYHGLVQSDLTRDLPIRDASLDAVVLSEVLMYLPAPDRLLAECHRVLKPGGAIVVYNPTAWLPALSGALKQAGRRLHQETASVAFDRQSDWRRARRPCRIAYFSAAGLRRAVTAAGFRINRVTAFRLFRDRVRGLRFLENHAWYYRAVTAVAARCPCLATDLLLVGRKAVPGGDR